MSITSQFLGSVKDLLIGFDSSDSWNSVLQSENEVERALEYINLARLLPHDDRPKNWDSLIALAAIINTFGRNATILDAGSEVYSQILNWLDCFGYRNLYGINIAFNNWFIQGRAIYQTGNIEQTEFHKDYFDAITCLSVLEHGVNVERFLNECYRILKPGGLLIFSVDYWDEGIYNEDKSYYGDPVHVFSANEIKQILNMAEKKGFEKTGDVPLDCKDKVVHWKEVDLRFTFINIALRKAIKNEIDCHKDLSRETQSLFDFIDLQVTFRCNMNCKNFYEFCNMQDYTGLDLKDNDMTLGQIKYFINNIKEIKTSDLYVAKEIHITGGEPLLHPNIKEITLSIYDELVRPGYIKQVFIDSNLTITPPQDLEKFIINYTKVKDKPKLHCVALLHPSEFSNLQPTFKDCNHIGKWKIVCNYFGYSLCCVGDAYARLINLEDLMLNQLPNSYASFPLEKMDLVCSHCPFGVINTPLEKDLGSPVSRIYLQEAEINKSGRKIMKKLPEL